MKGQGFEAKIENLELGAVSPKLDLDIEEK